MRDGMCLASGRILDLGITRLAPRRLAISRDESSIERVHQGPGGSHAQGTGNLEFARRLTALLRMAGSFSLVQPEPLHHAYEFGHRAHAHFFHHAGPMDLDGLLHDAQITGNLLVQLP